MNPVERVFRDFVDLFEQLGISYAVMGGLAVRAHGIPRPTYDVDVTIVAARDELPGLCQRIRDMGYDVPEEYFMGWVDHVAGMPLIKAATFVESRTLVADIFLAETEYQQSVMSRRIRDTVNGFEAWIVTPEDLILLKLIAARPRDIGDIIDVLTMQLHLDEVYLRKWADHLGVRDKLESILAEQY
jgi:hypothetical protein